MTQQTFFVFVTVSAVFLAGASVGRLLLRLRLARLERINMRFDERRLNALARALRSRATSHPERDGHFEREVRSEIETILTEIENA